MRKIDYFTVVVSGYSLLRPFFWCVSILISHQNPVEARFNTCFLPFISAIPAAIAVCILVGHVLRRLLVCLRRPRWSEAFVKELPDTFAESCPKAKRLSATLLVALLVASLSGLVLQVVTVVRPTFHWQAVYPTVSWVCASASLVLASMLTLNI